MHLAHFPVELLQEVLLHAESHCLINLWKCGDRTLTRKIQAATINVDLRSPIGFDCGVPLCLGELHSLRSMRLRGLNLFTNTSNWRKLLHKRFGDLELLAIDSPKSQSPSSSSAKLDIASGVLRSVFDFGASSPQPTPTELQRLLSQDKQSYLIDMVGIFPRLRSLELIFEAKIDASQFAGLPPTLTSLKLPSVEFIMSASRLDLPRLPVSLKTLEALVFTNWDTDHSKWDAIKEGWSKSPAFEHISDIFLREGPQTLEWLPRTLTSGCLRHFSGKWTYDFMRTLPPHLKSLELHDLNEQVLANEIDLTGHLPPDIEKLTVQCSGPHFIRQIPPKVTRLSIYGSHDFPLTLASDFWPSSLTTLNLNLVLQESCLALLPSTLTSLTVNELRMDDDGSEMWKYMEENTEVVVRHALPSLTFLNLWCSDYLILQVALPSSLRSIELLSGHRGLAPSSFAKLPNGLTSVTVTGSDDIDGALLPPSLTHFTLHSERIACVFNGLPSGLKKFSVPAHDISAYIGLELLPWSFKTSNLTEISLPYFLQGWFAEIPRSTTFLTIHALCGVPLPDSPPNDIFAALPAGLISFSVAKSYAGRLDATQYSLSKRGSKHEVSYTVFPATCFSHMRFLENLQVKTVGLFPSSVLRVLSPTLKTLHINLQSLETEDLPHIPPRLTAFNFLTAFTTRLDACVADHWPVRAVASVPPSQSHLRPAVKARMEQWLGRAQDRTE